MRHPYPSVASATAGNSTTLWDDGTGDKPKPDAPPSHSHIRTLIKVDQAVTVVHKWGPKRNTATGDLVIINGASYTGVTVAANTPTPFTFDLQPGRNLIYVTSGTPAPTATFYPVEAEDFPGYIL